MSIAKTASLIETDFSINGLYLALLFSYRYKYSNLFLPNPIFTLETINNFSAISLFMHCGSRIFRSKDMARTAN